MALCEVYHVPAEVVSQEEDCIIEDQTLDSGLAYLRSLNVPLKFGDLVIFDSIAGYRNNGVSIFDGEDLLDLEAEPDDYGTLPKQFHVLEAPHYFPINYWHRHEDDGKQRICHNTFVWWDHRSYREQLLSSIERSDEWCFRASFTGPDQKEYRVIFHFEDEFLNQADPRTHNGPIFMNTQYVAPELTPEWVERMKQFFIDQINKDELLTFSLWSNEEESEENTLYMN